MRGAGLPRARKQSGYADGGSTGREWKDLIVGAELLHGAVAPAGRRLSVDPRIVPNFHSPAVDVEDPGVGHPALGVEAGLLFTIESETRDGDLDDQGGARRMRVEEVPRATLNHRHIGLRLRVGAEGNRHLDPHRQPGPKALRSASATRRTAAACRAACGSLQTSSPPANSTPSSSWSNPRAMRRSYSARVHHRVRTCRTPIIPPRPEAIGRLRR